MYCRFFRTFGGSFHKVSEQEEKTQQASSSSFQSQKFSSSLKSADVTGMDKILEFISTLQLAVCDGVFCIVRSFKKVFVQVHENIDGECHINMCMAAHKFSHARHVRHHHPVFVLTSPIHNSARVIYLCSLLE